MQSILYEIFTRCDIKSALNLSATCSDYNFDWMDLQPTLFAALKLKTYKYSMLMKWLWRSKCMDKNILQACGLCCECRSEATIIYGDDKLCNQCLLKQNIYVDECVCGDKLVTELGLCTKCITDDNEECSICHISETYPDRCHACRNTLCLSCSLYGFCPGCRYHGITKCFDVDITRYWNKVPGCNYFCCDGQSKSEVCPRCEHAHYMCMECRIYFCKHLVVVMEGGAYCYNH